MLFFFGCDFSNKNGMFLKDIVSKGIKDNRVKYSISFVHNKEGDKRKMDSTCYDKEGRIVFQCGLSSFNETKRYRYDSNGFLTEVINDGSDKVYYKVFNEIDEDRFVVTQKWYHISKDQLIEFEHENQPPDFIRIYQFDKHARLVSIKGPGAIREIKYDDQGRSIKEVEYDSKNRQRVLEEVSYKYSNSNSIVEKQTFDQGHLLRKDSFSTSGLIEKTYKPYVVSYQYYGD
nr:YD repeat (two copies) [uncultured bacterium]